LQQAFVNHFALVPRQRPRIGAVVRIRGHAWFLR
jgi:hypothetical protein